MILPTALIIFNGVVMLTLAELPASDSGQQRLTPKYGDVVVSPPRFFMTDLSEQKSKYSSLKNLKVATHITKRISANFSDIPIDKKVMDWLLQDIRRGNHLLLVENRGSKTNTIVDRLLQSLNRPIEYIQLHSGTTIQTLTVKITVKDGNVIYEDSPLVKAVKNGYVLVVHEADEVPTKVACRLNTLMKNAEIVLSDGRRIIPKEIMSSSGGKSANFIPVHEDFRMIVLAGRTGFPFLENYFTAPLVFNISVTGSTVKAVGSSPVVTTVMIDGYGSGLHTATAIASGSAVATAIATTYGNGISTASALATGASSATASAYSYDAGVATATAMTSRSSTVSAYAIAKGNEVVTDTKVRN